MSALLLVLASAAPFAAWAETPPTPVDSPADAPLAGLQGQVEAIVAAIQEKYSDVSVIRADFVQVSKSALYGNSDEQTGTLVLQRPRKMRWQFTATGKQFVTDGDTMWIYNPEEKQVLRIRDFSAQASTADELLQSLHKVGELFDVRLLSKSEAGYELALAPRSEAAKAQVKSVRLRLSSSHDLRELEIVDAYDTVTELRFSNVRLGGEVEEATFDFTPPEGVEVIDSSAG